jgi:transcriptional regulator with XRE-family HTH domain
MHGGYLIREARRRAGLTQAELAERINTAQPNVARWESADMSPSVDVLSRIVQACGLELIVRLIPREANDWAVVEDSQAMSMDERLEKLIGFVDVVDDGAETKASRTAAKTNKHS